MNHSKMKKTARTLDTLVNVGGGIASAFFIVFLIFAVLVLILGEKMYAPGVSLDFDFLEVHLAESYQVITPMVNAYSIVSMLGMAAICFTVSYAAKLLRRILAPMKEGRPFEADIPANLRKIAWVVLFGGAGAELLGMIDRIILTKSYPMAEIFASEAITKIEYIFTMDFSFVLIFAVILFLSYIFSYGSALQQESDETI